ncbi:MAG TPA: SDR family NAD(P)-dependent oxidoreductase [Kribbellaceae bacterium]|nr:SDR family NAD(P)-dependent oxidoreductase [Kribbellaceae bacterium]
MTRRFEGRVALVTAAGQGIGRAVAHRLAAEGCAVAVTDLSPDTAEAVSRELAEAAAVDASAAGTSPNAARSFAIACDVTSDESVRAAVAATVERYGRLDVLVNNAGGCIVRASYEEATTEDWHHQLDLSLVGASRCIKAALPHLVETRGAVVSVGSVNGLVAFGNVEYSAAKAGLQSLTRNLAARYGREGVRFNVVAPGTVRTPNWDDQQEALSQLTKLYPLGRVGEPEDIAAAVAFLASDDAAWITGVTLPVEGGVLTGPIGFQLS